MDDQQKPSFSDEVDLGQLFSRFLGVLKSIGFGFLRFLAILRRAPVEHWVLFSIVILIAISSTLGYGVLLKKKFYESTMILSSNYLNKRIVDNIIGKLNLLADEGSKTGLSKVLDIPDSLAINIARFEAKPFVAEADIVELEILKEQLKNAKESSKNGSVIDQVIRRIEIENRHAFEITVRTFTPTAITNLQVSLVEYFRTNQYVQKRINSNELLLQARKNKLIHESKKLDSLKEVIYANYKTMSEQARDGSNNVILSDRSVTNPIDVFAQDLKLYQDIQQIDHELNVKPDFEVVDGFTEFSEPASASLAKMAMQAFLVGLGLSYLILALIRFNNYLAEIS